MRDESVIGKVSRGEAERVERASDKGEGRGGPVLSSCNVPTLVRLDRTKNFQRRPCDNCPWRTDAQLGEFPAERFRALAHTAYDMEHRVFTCHRSVEENPVVCAGFLLRGADHNLTVRVNYAQATREVDADGLELYPSYRAMAIANGVDPDDPALVPCRD